MKKFLALVLAALMLVSIVGCSKNSSSTSNESGKSVKNSESSKVESIDFGSFENVGNDPNNLLDSEMAFDDNYIYFDRSDGLYRVDYNGNDCKIVHSYENYNQYGDKNIYKGYLYYGYRTEIHRLNLDTFSDELIIKEEPPKDIHRASKVYKGKCSIGSMYIANGVLFYTVISGSESTSYKIYAMNLDQSLNSKLLLSDSESLEFTSDANNVYAVRFYSNTIYKISFEDLAASDKGLEELGNIKNCKDGSMYYFPTGICYLDEEELKYKYCAYEDIHFNSEGTSVLSDLNNSLEITRSDTNGHMRILSNNIISLRMRDHNIRIYKNFDFNVENIIGNFQKDLIMGSHDGKLYFIDDDGVSTTWLSTIDSDGNITRTEIEAK